MYKNPAARRPLNTINDQNLREKGRGRGEGGRERDKVTRKGVSVHVHGGPGGCIGYLYTMVRRIEREEEERERKRGREQTCFPFRCRLDPCSYQLQDGPPAHTD